MIETETNAEQDHANIGERQVARVYAEALLNVGWDSNKGQELYDDLDGLIHSVFPSNPQFEEFLASGAVDSLHKAQVIRDTFTGRTEEQFVNFLLVLNNHGRLNLLRPIRNSYLELFDQRQKRVRVQVTSAVPLDDGQKQKLTDELRELTQQEPILEMRTDPELIGGMMVRVGDYLYDASVKTRLDVLRDQLIERSSHEIQTGRDRFSSD